jgi:hypothetical protein
MPWARSRGSAVSTRRTSTPVVPAAAMVRRPASASTSRVAISPCASWYPLALAVVSRRNARSTIVISTNPAAKAAGNHGSMSRRATRLPTVGMSSASALTTVSGARPASSAFMPTRVTRSPSASRRVIAGPTPSTCRTIRWRSHAVTRAPLAPVAHTPTLSQATTPATMAAQPASQPLRSGSAVTMLSTVRPRT